MGFLTRMFSAVGKTALTPLTIAKDAVEAVTGEEPEITSMLLESVV